MFEARGAAMLHADEVAREVVAPGSPALAAIRREFGPAVFHPDGTLDRAALGKRVFSDPEARRRLEAITHPPIRSRIVDRLAEWRAAEPEARPRLVILEHPLLFEANQTALVEGIILVVAQQTTQVERLMAVRRLTEEQAWARVRSQLPAAAKIPLADWVIDGEAPLPEVERCVEQIWNELQGSDASKG
jgi:dephospho-CoA kinase